MTMNPQCDPSHPTNPKYINLTKVLIEKYEKYKNCDKKIDIENEIEILELEKVKTPIKKIF